MPLYEYHCPGCGLDFEQIRPFRQAKDSPPCPRCQQPAKRKLSVFASFSTDESGLTTPVAGKGSSCSGCSATNCSSCGI